VLAACSSSGTTIGNAPTTAGATHPAAHAGPTGSSSTTTSTPGPSSTSSSAPPAGTTGAGSTGSDTASRVDKYGVVWLCRPGIANNPCTSNLDSTTVGPPGTLQQVVHTSPNPRSRFDCFYVYPTVSTESTMNADLAIQPAETGVAIAQASRFSQVCRVYAPIYRQVTQDGLLRYGLAGGSAVDVAYASMLQGWNDYLEHYNDGRPIIFIGHSQGAALLILLLQRVVEPDPALLDRMVTAIILGGNVQVPVGRDVGGTFSSIPACTSPGENRCVIAYSTFYRQPPPGSQFGRPGQGVSLQSGQTASAGEQVVCVNPASIGGGSASLLPFFVGAAELRRLGTPWVSFPDLYTASCESSGGATWLQVNVVRSTGDLRPAAKETLGPNYGLHKYDVNLALGSLVDDVAAAETAHPG
jgi:hypothetical protein